MALKRIESIAPPRKGGYVNTFEKSDAKLVKR
jgi:hypothetical protein